MVIFPEILNVCVCVCVLQEDSEIYDAHLANETVKYLKHAAANAKAFGPFQHHLWAISHLIIPCTHTPGNRTAIRHISDTYPTRIRHPSL